MSEVLEQEQVPQIVVNLGRVEYLITTALAKLVSFRIKVGERGGTFRLCSLQPAVREVMEITKFDELFDICENEPDALVGE